jgi:hypothetical protein
MVYKLLKFVAGISMKTHQFNCLVLSVVIFGDVEY